MREPVTRRKIIDYLRTIYMRYLVWSNLLVNSLQPFLIRHLNGKDNVKIAFLVWSLVDRHSFTPYHNGVVRFDDFARRSGDLHATAIQVSNQYPREAQ